MVKCSLIIWEQPCLQKKREIIPLQILNVPDFLLFLSAASSAINYSIYSKMDWLPGLGMIAHFTCLLIIIWRGLQSIYHCYFRISVFFINYSIYSKMEWLASLLTSPRDCPLHLLLSIIWTRLTMYFSRFLCFFSFLLYFFDL